VDGFPRTTEQKVGTRRADRLSDGLAVVAAEVVDHHHIARPQGRHQNAFDVGAEDVAVHRTVEHSWGVDPVVAERSDEGGRDPVPEGSSPRQAFVSGCPAPQRSHVGLRPGFVNEDQPCRVDPPLITLPPVAAAFHVRAFALIGDRRRFLKLSPQPRRNRQTVSWLTTTPRPDSMS